jgi:predicted nucleotidyltransferase
MMPLCVREKQSGPSFYCSCDAMNGATPSATAMIPLIEQNRDKIAELCRAHHVRRLSVFGSAVRDDFDLERSDIDLLVEFYDLPAGRMARNYFSLANALSDLFHRPVDLVEPQALKDPHIRREVEATQATLYAA